MSKGSRKRRVLLTAAPEDVEAIIHPGREPEYRWVHLPLEKYRAVSDGATDSKLAAKIEAAETIIYGHKRNALFLMRKTNKPGLSDLLKGRVNLAADETTAGYLEAQGVPAIYPGSDEPIKMVEFLLRLRRLGDVFYPCGDHMQEEIPGLLKELDIGVTEHVLYRLEGPSDKELVSYRQEVMENHFDAVVYHSRGAVNRTQAAFPNLNLERAAVVAADRGVAEKLAGSDVEVDAIAEGNWKSVLEVLGEESGKES